MKLWVDDIRNAPDDTWHVARTVTAAIRALAMFEFEEVSLDHDISHQVSVGELSRPFPCDETFEAVAHYIAEKALASGRFEDRARRWDPKVVLHTSNPVGAQAMKEVLYRGFITDIQVRPFGAANRLEMEV